MANNSTNLSAQYIVLGFGPQLIALEKHHLNQKLTQPTLVMIPTRNLASQLILYIVLTLLNTSNSDNDFNKFKQLNLTKISYVPTRFIK